MFSLFSALRIILQSMWLLNAFQSLDPSTDRVRISSIIPEQPPASYLSSVSGGRKKPAKFNEGVDFRIEADNTWGGVQVRSPSFFSDTNFFLKRTWVLGFFAVYGYMHIYLCLVLLSHSRKPPSTFLQMNFKHTKAISIIFERTASVSHASVRQSLWGKREKEKKKDPFHSMSWIFLSHSYLHITQLPSNFPSSIDTSLGIVKQSQRSTLQHGSHHVSMHDFASASREGGRSIDPKRGGEGKEKVPSGSEEEG